MTTTIRLRGPADIIAVLPYHLGYRPHDSLVVVCLRRGRIGVVGRLDLPPPDVDPALVVEELMPVVAREAPDAVVLVGVESRQGDAEPASAAMRDALEACAVRVLDRLVVRDGRWWSLDCDGPCCPADGEALPPEEAVPAVSDYVLRGRRPAPSRASLAERLVSRADEAQAIRCAAFVEALTSGASSRSTVQRRRRRVLQHWARILDPRPTGPDAVAQAPAPGDEAWAWAVASLVDVTLRDLLIAWLCPGTLDLAVFPVALRRTAESELPSRLVLLGPAGDLGDLGDLGEFGEFGEFGDPGDPDHPDDSDDPLADGLPDALVDRLAAVCRAAPVPLSVGPLTVLAHVAWWRGDGALARTALDAALAVDPDYRLALLLERMVDVAVRPRMSA